jgi:hypothetical protein
LASTRIFPSSTCCFSVPGADARACRSSQDRVERGAGAAKRDVEQFDAGRGCKHFHRHMQRAIGPGRAIGNLTGAAFGIIDKIPQRLPRRRGRHREQGGIGENARNGRELRHFVHRRTIEQAIGLRQHSQRGQRHQECVTIRLRACRCSIADGATCPAGAIVDDDGLAENLFQRQRHRPGGEIGLTAGREWHYHGDRVGRPRGLGCGRDRSGGLQQRQRGGPLEKFASIHRQLFHRQFFLPGFSLSLSRAGYSLNRFDEQRCSRTPEPAVHAQ